MKYCPYAFCACLNISRHWQQSILWFSSIPAKNLILSKTTLLFPTAQSCSLAPKLTHPAPSDAQCTSHLVLEGKMRHTRISIYYSTQAVPISRSTQLMLPRQLYSTCRYLVHVRNASARILSKFLQAEALSSPHHRHIIACHLVGVNLCKENATSLSFYRQ